MWCFQAFAKYIKNSGEEAVLTFKRFGSFSSTVQSTCQTRQRIWVCITEFVWLDEMPYEEIPTLYSLADIVLNVPEQDGLPVTLFEVSACKVPIITSDLPSYQDYLSEGDYFRVGNGGCGRDRSQDAKDIGGFRIKDITDGLQKNYDLVVKSADQEKCFAVIEKIYQDVQNCA